MVMLPSPYHIRSMRDSDLEAVLDIDSRAFPTPTPHSTFIYELNENKLAHYHVLTRCETVLGYAGYWLMGDEMHISTLAIHPERRGGGLGELLLLNMLTIAQQNPVTMVTLEVRESNSVAQTLYTKYRFDVVGRRKRYYRDTGEDALLMTRTPLDAPYWNFLERAAATLFARMGA